MKPIILTQVIFSFFVGLAAGLLTLFAIYQPTLEKAKRFSPENFEKMNVVIIGKVDSISENLLVLNRQGVKFPIQIKENTLILVPDEEAREEIIEAERPPVKRGEFQDLSVGKMAEVIVNFSDGSFRAMRVMVLPATK